MPKQPKDPNAPKRPLSAYFCWLKENRARIAAQPNMTTTGIIKQAGVEWRALQNKDRWNQLAAAEKQRYEREMTAYRSR